MKINVGVMFGGESVEHEVSIISALQAIEAIDQSKYNPIPIYISKKSDLFISDKLFDISTYQDLDKLEKECSQVYLYKEKQKVFISPIKQRLFKNEKTSLDVIIPIMHGTNGEDGVLQGYLEMLNIPYSGSDVTASAIGQDKVIMKQVFESNNIPIVDWFWLYSHQFTDQKKYLKMANQLGYPLVIKPANLGSSIGISIVNSDEDFIKGINAASEYDVKIVVEKAITNLREVNCSVLGDIYNNQTSVIEEVGKADEILSFEDKYISNAKGKHGQKSQGMASTKREVPAKLSKDLEDQVHKLSKDVVFALNSSGVCRIDFLLDSESEKLYVNEINSMPGSLAFYLWKEKGVDFSEIMDSLISQAIDRQRRKENMTFSYSSNILSSYSANGSKGSKKI
ncbi:MAG TPA: D-alanine--D-alanine ligase family protein [Erysipelotrichaceae bacterium]|nr:D-alanine--D-alanine ligase family protein [Erysipelotrichaceae bacterium]